MKGSGRRSRIGPAGGAARLRRMRGDGVGRARAGAAQASQPHLGFGSPRLDPGNLLVSTSQYREADIQPGVTVLPPGCTSGCATATADGAYPYVFNNDIVDPSFGVAAPIVLDQFTPTGHLLSQLPVPTGQLVTSSRRSPSSR